MFFKETDQAMAFAVDPMSEAMPQIGASLQAAVNRVEAARENAAGVREWPASGWSGAR